MKRNRKLNKSATILDIISGSSGMRFTDIQRALWYMSHRENFTREERGYWCTALVGGAHYHGGLLNTYCVKGSDGLWRRNNTPHNNRPWAHERLSKAGW